MAKKIHQFTDENIVFEGNILQNYPRVTKLGIQGQPNYTSFKINGSNDSIVIGRYGIYELDLTGLGGMINSLEFVNTVDNKDYKMIVDIIYEGGTSS